MVKFNLIEIYRILLVGFWKSENIKIMEKEYKLPIDLINAINDEKLAIFIGANKL